MFLSQATEIESGNHKSNVSSSSGGSLSGFPEEDLRTEGRNNSGYFPARLGQCFEDGRYCVVRKLGWGQYSNVWLALDKAHDRFVSLKILTCEATKAAEKNLSDELGFLQIIASAKTSHRGYRHNIKYHDTFRFKGLHGDHQCIVTEALGFSLDYVRKMREDRSVYPNVVKRFVKQIAMGLEYLHNECNIIHADIKHDNILFRPKNLTEVVAHELVSSPSVSYDCGTQICPPVVPIVSQALPPTTDKIIPNASLEAVKGTLAHRTSHHFQEIIQPNALRAPEVILGYKWDTPADIWNLGCIVVELLIGCWLFEPYSTPDWDYEEDHLARMTEALETAFDNEFLSKCEHKLKFFKEDEKKEETELDLAVQFIHRCLKLIPEQRATATELIDDPWLQSVEV